MAAAKIKGYIVMKCEEIRELMPELASGLMAETETKTKTAEIGKHLAAQRAFLVSQIEQAQSFQQL